MGDIVYGWHFLDSRGCAYGDYVPPAVGVWEPRIDNPEPCVRGYHGSPTILDALPYADGPILGRCEYRGVVWHPDGDKWAARERRCIARVDASALLRFAACHFAEAALKTAGIKDECSWNTIAVARRFALGAATVAEMSAAHDAARSASHSPARYAARYTAYPYAHNAARYASCYAHPYAARKAQSTWLESAWLESAALDLDTAPEWTRPEEEVPRG